MNQEQNFLSNYNNDGNERRSSLNGYTNIYTVYSKQRNYNEEQKYQPNRYVSNSRKVHINPSQDQHNEASNFNNELYNRRKSSNQSGQQELNKTFSASRICSESDKSLNPAPGLQSNHNSAYDLHHHRDKLVHVNTYTDIHQHRGVDFRRDLINDQKVTNRYVRLSHASGGNNLH